MLLLRQVIPLKKFKTTLPIDVRIVLGRVIIKFAAAYTFFQVFGLKRISTGRISSLPISIVNVSSIFEKAL